MTATETKDVLEFLVGMFVFAVLGALAAEKVGKFFFGTAAKQYVQPENPIVPPQQLKKPEGMPPAPPEGTQIREIEPSDVMNFISDSPNPTPAGVVQIYSADDRIQYQFKTPPGFQLDRWATKQHEEMMPHSMRLQLVSFYGTRILMITMQSTTNEPLLKYILSFSTLGYSELRRRVDNAKQQVLPN